MNDKKKCNGTAIAYGIAVLGAFLIVGGLVWIMNIYTRPTPLGEDRADFRRKALEGVRAADGEVMNNKGYTWEDQGKGIVRLPIDRAIELSIQNWQDPKQARSNLFARTAKKFFIPPPVNYD